MIYFTILSLSFGSSGFEVFKVKVLPALLVPMLLATKSRRSNQPQRPHSSLSFRTKLGIGHRFCGFVVGLPQSATFHSYKVCVLNPSFAVSSCGWEYWTAPWFPKSSSIATVCYRPMEAWSLTVTLRCFFLPVQLGQMKLFKGVSLSFFRRGSFTLESLTVQHSRQVW